MPRPSRGPSGVSLLGLTLILGACGVTEPDTPEVCAIAGAETEVWSSAGAIDPGANAAGGVTVPTSVAAIRIPPTPSTCGRLLLEVERGSYPPGSTEHVSIRTAVPLPDFGMEVGEEFWTTYTDEIPSEAPVLTLNVNVDTSIDVWIVARVFGPRPNPTLTSAPVETLAVDSVRIPLRFRPTREIHPAQRIQIDLTR